MRPLGDLQKLSKKDCALSSEELKRLKKVAQKVRSERNGGAPVKKEPKWLTREEIDRVIANHRECYGSRKSPTWRTGKVTPGPTNENAAKLEREADELAAAEKKKAKETDEERVQRISKRLQEVSKTAYPASVIKSNELNAETDGETIKITQGLLKKASDDEVAYVLGHEIAHNEIRLIHNKNKNEWLDKQAEEFLKTEIPGFFGMILQTAVFSFNLYAGSKNIDQGKELIADKIGAKIASDAGYDPNAAKTIIKKINGSDNSMFSTHPTTKRRIDNLDK